VIVVIAIVATPVTVAMDAVVVIATVAISDRQKGKYTNLA
jgi:hypothetical protein